MIAGGSGHYTANRLCRGQLGHAVAGAAPFIRFDRGEVLPFGPDLGLWFWAGQDESFHRRRLAKPVYAFPGHENFPVQLLVEGEGDVGHVSGGWGHAWPGLFPDAELPEDEAE